MTDLNIEGSQSSPAISASWEQGILSIKGDSYPENTFELFGPVIAWVEHYLKDARQPLTLDLHLVYLNTSSIKAMMDIFDLMEAGKAQNRNVAVNWYYDSHNERVAELAEEFKEDCTFPFAILPCQD